MIRVTMANIVSIGLAGFLGAALFVGVPKVWATVKSNAGSA